MPRRVVLLVLLGLVILAARPLWTLSFFDSYDGPSHLYRLFALDYTLRQGVVSPRWLLPLAYGLGYPIYNFYPPLAGYVAETIHLLGIGFVDALKIAFTLCLVIGAGGAYLLGAELYRNFPQSKLAALLTATAYIFFPYWMIGIYTRGAIAEVMALAIVPWLFWALRRALRLQKVSGYVLVAILLATLIITHSLTTVIISPLWVLFALLSIWRMSRRAQLSAVAHAVGSVVLALGLAAFYWLPFVAELKLVQMGQGYDRIIQVFDTNFLKPENVIQPALFYQYGGPPTPLGLVAMGLAFSSFILAFFAKNFRERSLVIGFGVALTIATLAITEPARPFWLQVSLASLIQSVWRVTSLITLCVAVMIGALPVMLPTLSPCSNALRTPQRQAIFSGVIAILIVVAAIARLAPSELLLPPDALSLSHLARFEVNDGTLGTTTFGEYLPMTVEAPDLISYQAPQGAVKNPLQVQILEQHGADWLLDVNAGSPVRLTLRILNFPDRAAFVDGARVPTKTASDLGLLAIDVPAGSHRVAVSTEVTLPRRIGIGLSFAAILVALVMMGFAYYNREDGAWMPVAASALLFLIFGSTNLVALVSNPAPVIPQSIDVASAKLVGVAIDGAEWEQGIWTVPNVIDVLPLRAYWRVKQSGQPPIPIQWRLVDASGSIRAERAQIPNFGTAPQSSWLSNELVLDQSELPLPVYLTRGQYQLQVAAGSSKDFQTVVTVVLMNDAAIARLRLPQHAVNANVGARIQFLGYDAPETAYAGETLPIRLYWQVDGDIAEDFRGSLQLLDASGKLVAQNDGVTGQGIEPTSLWIPNRTVVEQRTLDLPRDLPSGGYMLIAVLYRLIDGQRLHVTAASTPSPDAIGLGQVRVENSFPSLP